MKQLIPFVVALGLLMPAVRGEEKAEAAKEKPAASETTKTEKNANKTAVEKKKESKPAELSASDKELMAEAKKEADSLSAAQRTRLLELLNKGDSKALEAIDGIGDTRAKNIMRKRPFAKVEDAAMVDGIGIGIFKNLCASVRSPAKEGKPKSGGKEKPDSTKSDKPASEKAPTKPAKPDAATTKKNS